MTLWKFLCDHEKLVNKTRRTSYRTHREKSCMCVALTGRCLSAHPNVSRLLKNARAATQTCVSSSSFCPRLSVALTNLLFKSSKVNLFVARVLLATFSLDVVCDKHIHLKQEATHTQLKCVSQFWIYGLYIFKLNLTSFYGYLIRL